MAARPRPALAWARRTLRAPLGMLLALALGLAGVCEGICPNGPSKARAEANTAAHGHPESSHCADHPERAPDSTPCRHCCALERLAVHASEKWRPLHGSVVLAVSTSPLVAPFRFVPYRESPAGDSSLKSFVQRNMPLLL